ncbi:ATP-grasp domain-containing protein [Listeria booriae]|uniref:ATP-grasp domain-containing protein n=1 Tax=Listeria booriae TaxID=1552123 RepID=UPI0016277772|nr:ATP-grasp domain-containing protein [Listeria booriae]MBC1553185.1 ATP-grasp domain-containing protein [Listeria booriae]
MDDILVISKKSLVDNPYHELINLRKYRLVLIIDIKHKQSTIKYSNLYEKIIYIENYFDDNLLMNYVNLFATKYNFTRVVATSELDVVRSAKIRELLNVKNGQNLDSAVAFRDKIKMKDYIKNVSVPEYRKINDFKDVVNFYKRLYPSPIIVKPVDGAGSIGVHKVSSLKGLLLLKNSLLKNCEVEEYIDGEMYIVNGYMHNNKIQSIWCMKYVSDCLSFRDGNQAISIQLNKNNKIIPDLLEATDSILKDLPTCTSFPFHLELFVRKDKEIVFCEIASRVGGGATNDAGKYIVGHNLLFDWIRNQVENTNIIKNKIKSNKVYAQVSIPPKDGVLKFIPKDTPFDWVLDYNIRASLGIRYKKPSSSAHRIISLVIEGASENDLITKINTLNNWSEGNIIWEKGVDFE